ncbi:hypothetical protein M1N05_01150 [Dehalococcoidales bacterium]|nr:hypothetical protein [Dehalococcoidales bacterium]
MVIVLGIGSGAGAGAGVGACSTGAGTEHPAAIVSIKISASAIGIVFAILLFIRLPPLRTLVNLIFSPFALDLNPLPGRVAWHSVLVLCPKYTGDEARASTSYFQSLLSHYLAQ